MIDDVRGEFQARLDPDTFFHLKLHSRGSFSPLCSDVPLILRCTPNMGKPIPRSAGWPAGSFLLLQTIRFHMSDDLMHPGTYFHLKLHSQGGLSSCHFLLLPLLRSTRKVPHSAGWPAGRLCVPHTEQVLVGTCVCEDLTCSFPAKLLAGLVRVVGHRVRERGSGGIFCQPPDNSRTAPI